MKENRATILKYVTALVVTFELLMLSNPTELLLSGLLKKQSYSVDTDYSTNPKLAANLEYAVFGDAFTEFVILGVALGAGSFVSLMLWNKQERRKIPNLIFIPFVFTIVPFSFMNYGQGDELFDRRVQVLTDLIICILGFLILLKTLTVQTHSRKDLVFKTIIIFLISSQAVLIPCTYAILWHSNIRAYISSANAEILSGHDLRPYLTNSYPTWITYITMFGGLILSLLTYNWDLKKLGTDKFLNR